MIRQHACWSITCDRNCDGQGWGEDYGVPHFTTEAEAIKSARDTGFVIVGSTILCQECAAKADCAATGHQWDPWEDREQDGVPYRHRWCDHCTDSDYDPPWRELVTLLDAARIVNGGAPC